MKVLLSVLCLTTLAGMTFCKDIDCDIEIRDSKDNRDGLYEKWGEWDQHAYYYNQQSRLYLYWSGRWDNWHIYNRLGDESAYMYSDGGNEYYAFDDYYDRTWYYWDRDDWFEDYDLKYGCADDENYETVHYVLVKQEKEWIDAKHYCEDYYHDGTLANIYDADENYDAWRECYYNDCWIGYRARGGSYYDFEWTFLNNGYERWAYRQPDYDRGDSCARFDHSYAEDWFDDPCDERYWFICEYTDSKEKRSIPTTTIAAIAGGISLGAVLVGIGLVRRRRRRKYEVVETLEEENKTSEETAPAAVEEEEEEGEKQAKA